MYIRTLTSRTFTLGFFTCNPITLLNTWSAQPLASVWWSYMFRDFLFWKVHGWECLCLRRASLKNVDQFAAKICWLIIHFGNEPIHDSRNNQSLTSSFVDLQKQFITKNSLDVKIQIGQMKFLLKIITDGNKVVDCHLKTLKKPRTLVWIKKKYSLGDPLTEQSNKFMKLIRVVLPKL